MAKIQSTDGFGPVWHELCAHVHFYSLILSFRFFVFVFVFYFISHDIHFDDDVTSNGFCLASTSIADVGDGGCFFFYFCSLSHAPFQCLLEDALYISRCFCSMAMYNILVVCVCERNFLLPTSYHINVMLIFSVMFSYYSQSSQNPGVKAFNRNRVFFLSFFFFPFIAMGHESGWSLMLFFSLHSLFLLLLLHFTIFVGVQCYCNYYERLVFIKKSQIESEWELKDEDEDEKGR